MSIKRKTRKPSKKSRSNAADRLFSELVRKRYRCEAAGLAPGGCGGPHQCAHVFGRRLRVIRWDEENALCLCRDHHAFFTYRPEMWFSFIHRQFPGRWDSLEAKAQHMWDRDIESVISRLKEALDGSE